MYNQGQQNIYSPSFGQPINQTPQPKKKLNLFMIATIIETLVIIILLVVTFMPNEEASIADDKSENVSFSKSGQVDAIGIVCKMPNETISFDKKNSYIIEKNRENVQIITSDDDETFAPISPADDADEVTYFDADEDDIIVNESELYLVEKGTYTVDGFNLKLKPDNDTSYDANYSKHKLTYKGHDYNCENL